MESVQISDLKPGESVSLQGSSCSRNRPPLLLFPTGPAGGLQMSLGSIHPCASLLHVWTWDAVCVCLVEDFIYLFLERGEGREKEREIKIELREISCLSHTPNWGPGLQAIPDWELNQQPFGLQPGTQSTEPHQPGQGCCVFFNATLLYPLCS